MPAESCIYMQASREMRVGISKDAFVLKIIIMYTCPVDHKMSYRSARVPHSTASGPVMSL
jgi:hypothetical protein